MLSFFTLAFFVGMRHALEADHVAAVSSLASNQTSTRNIVRTGAVWGMGHTLTLMAFAGSVIVLNATVPEHFTQWLEVAVGIMLIGLGGHIMYRLTRDRVHFHAHAHDDGRGHSLQHFHAHSHAEAPPNTHNPAHHQHDHKAFPVRSLLVGMMHGMAGSGALLVLTASTAPTPLQGFAYVAVFGVGSILGMASLSILIAVPLTLSARFLTRANQVLQVLTGTATVGLGVFIISTSALWGF